MMSRDPRLMARLITGFKLQLDLLFLTQQVRLDDACIANGRQARTRDSDQQFRSAVDDRNAAFDGCADELASSVVVKGVLGNFLVIAVGPLD